MKVDLGKVEVRAELRQAGRKAERIPAQVRQVYYSQVHSVQCCTGAPARCTTARCTLHRCTGVLQPGEAQCTVLHR